MPNTAQHITHTDIHTNRHTHTDKQTHTHAHAHTRTRTPIDTDRQIGTHKCTEGETNIINI